MRRPANGKDPTDDGERERRREERRTAHQCLNDLNAAVEALCQIDPRAFPTGSLTAPIKRLQAFALTVKTTPRW
jgi:hypothetical protein